MDLKAVLQRIEVRLTDLKKSPEKASMDSDMSRDAIRNMRRHLKNKGNDGGGAQAQTITNLCKGLETNTAWLLDGVGDRWTRESHIQTIADLDRLKPDMMARVARLVGISGTLSKEQLASLDVFLDGLAATIPPPDKPKPPPSDTDEEQGI